jgi:RNA polymerase sigma factor (sigma-70 family)
MSACCATPPRPAPPCARPPANGPPLRRDPSPPGRPTTGATGQPTVQKDRPDQVQAFAPVEDPEHPQQSRCPKSPDAHCPQHQAAFCGSPATTGDATAPLEAAELLRRAAKGDPAAWEEIMRRYSGLVIAKVRAFRLQDADALDAVQTTWLRLAENIHRIHHPERIAGWLATTAARECLHILRQAKRTQTLTDAVVDHTADPAASSEQRVINAHTAQTLRALIAELPPRRRRLLRALFADHPASYAELSRATGIPLGSIGPTRNRALHQLRQKLQDHQLPPPA